MSMLILSFTHSTSSRVIKDPTSVPILTFATLSAKSLSSQTLYSVQLRN